MIRKKTTIKNQRVSGKKRGDYMENRWQKKRLSNRHKVNIEVKMSRRPLKTHGQIYIQFDLS